MNEATPQQQQSIAVITAKLEQLGVIEQASFVFIAIGIRDLFVSLTVAGCRYQGFVGVKGNIWSYSNRRKIIGELAKTPLLTKNHED